VILCYLEDNLILLPQISIVGVDEHELVVIGHIVVLVYLEVFVDDVQLNRILLNQKLRILMNKKRYQIVMLPLAVIVGIIQVIDMLQLVFVITRINFRL
jgi:hypothetical protein